jgi:hypothetical protein
MGHILIKFTKKVIMGILLRETLSVISHRNREEEHYRIR